MIKQIVVVAALASGLFASVPVASAADQCGGASWYGPGFNGKKTAFEYRADATKEGKQFDFVPRLWAIRKVGYLMEEIRLHGEKRELKDEIVTLGKKYGIVTPYTSYLVLEDTPVQVARPRPPSGRPLEPMVQPADSGR